MKTNGVPKIRFKGFTDDWEQRKLGEIAEFNPKSDLPDEFEYVDLESVVGTEMVFHRTENKASAPSRAQRVAKTGDVFFQTVRPYQRNNYLFSMPYENYVFSTGYAQMRPKINAAFLMCFLQTESFVQNVLDNCTGTSYPAINSSDLSNLKISLPILKSEQSKIGELISNLDHLITLHQRKCEQTKELKKYMLQKMFPKKGEKNPEIRFPGFTDDWEQRKFPEFVEFYNGLTYSPDDVRASGTLVLRSSNVKNGEIVDADNVYVEPDKATSENVKEGDIIVVVRNGSRALIGKHAEIKESMSNTVIGAFMSGIRSEHSSFVNALLDTNQFEKEIEKNMGATINQITGYMFSKMEFTIPSPTEQDKIGNYFKYLDHLITLHQRKVFYTLKHIFYRCCDTLLSGGL